MKSVCFLTPEILLYILDTRKLILQYTSLLKKIRDNCIRTLILGQHNLVKLFTIHVLILQQHQAKIQCQWAGLSIEIPIQP